MGSVGCYTEIVKGEWDDVARKRMQWIERDERQKGKRQRAIPQTSMYHRRRDDLRCAQAVGNEVTAPRVEVVTLLPSSTSMRVDEADTIWQAVLLIHHVCNVVEDMNQETGTELREQNVETK